MNRPAPRLVLAALRGGAGKTAISLAVTVAMQKRGIGVVPFKKGPDYIDAAWLSLAGGGPCYNLDTFLIGREQVLRSFSRRAPADSISLIEGNRGLYDGMNPEGEHSTAELAKLLRAPVILVVDCNKVTRTTAAMVLGCRHLDPEVDIRGVILNLVGGNRHGAIARRAVEDYGQTPVLGIVPRMDKSDFPFPERHLGLVPPQEHERTRLVLVRAGEIAEDCLDMEGLIRIARNAPAWQTESPCAVVPAADKPSAEAVTIGVIRDRAFQFYYHENIEALADAGARIVEISAIDGKGLPEVDALYIGGGFPETQAGMLSGNEAFRRSLRDAAENSLPIYAECGGFIYLGESLTIGDDCYPMVGALSVSFGMERRPQGHGYTILEVAGENPFFPVGMQLRGHEFHYCRVLSCGAEGERMAFRVRRGAGIDGKRDGMTRKNILAGFTHLHALGTPEWAPALVEKARIYHAERITTPHHRGQNDEITINFTQVKEICNMATIELLGKTYEVDEDGFLQELDKWSEEFAQAYAHVEDIEGTLTEEHWKVINYLRNYYQQFGIAPMIRKICKDLGIDMKKLYELFPTGPAKGACKLAGLSKPTGCV